jgi:predicted metal-dependent phosphotriesterase family hydrolase
MPSPVSQSESHASSGAAVVQGQVTPQMEEKKKETHPSEWTLEEVIEWLKSKGFDQDVCDKFIGMSFCSPAVEIHD